MKVKNRLNIFRFLIPVPVFLSIVAVGNGQSISQGVPDKIEKKAKYLFYLHGRIIEVKGIRPNSEKYGVYEYEKILETLKNKGFFVISEARKGNTNISNYAQKVASQVRVLLEAGVSPGHITVVGASKGAVIAMQVSTILQNKGLNFVFMAGCNDMIYQRFDIAFYGNILSIYDEKDEIAGTCQKFFKTSTGINTYKEIKLNVGTGHGILYKPLKEWIDPVVDWARQSK
jgi:hypothetical protein